MSDENKEIENEEIQENNAEDELSLDSLAEFGDKSTEEPLTIEEDEVVLAEDLDGFAKGFPNWDLLPPKN